VFVEAGYCAIMELIKILLVTFAIISFVGFAAGDKTKVCEHLDGEGDRTMCSECCKNNNMMIDGVTFTLSLGKRCRCKESPYKAIVPDTPDPVDNQRARYDYEGDPYQKQLRKEVRAQYGEESSSSITGKARQLSRKLSGSFGRSDSFKRSGSFN
jgi:hypothetical protein